MPPFNLCILRASDRRPYNYICPSPHFAAVQRHIVITPIVPPNILPIIKFIINSPYFYFVLILLCAE